MNAPSIRLVRPGIGVSVALLALLIVAARFWLHDAWPYMSDYTPETYARYWPNRLPLLLHIAGGTVALFAGPWQLWSGPKARFRRVHRWLGYAYAAGIAVAVVASLYLSFFTKPDFGLSLFVLAIAWMGSVGMAIVAVRNRRIDTHREWMARSYIITFAFASFRLLVDLSVVDGLGSGKEASMLWLSWVVPMMVFEGYAQRRRIMPVAHRSAALPRDSEPYGRS